MWNIRTHFIQNEKITSHFLPNSLSKVWSECRAVIFPWIVEEWHSTRTPHILVIPHWAERHCAVKNSPVPLIPLKLHSAGEKNVPEASRKSCVARPSGVSVSGGWCGTPSEAKVCSTTHTPRAASTGHHPEWAWRMKGSSKKSARRKSKEGLGVNFDWRRSMASCARRAGGRRAHGNWRRLKEGWLSEAKSGWIWAKTCGNDQETLKPREIYMDSSGQTKIGNCNWVLFRRSFCYKGNFTEQLCYGTVKK